jgi:hypothetical protein
MVPAVQFGGIKDSIQEASSVIDVRVFQQTSDAVREQEERKNVGRHAKRHERKKVEKPVKK